MPLKASLTPSSRIKISMECSRCGGSRRSPPSVVLPLALALITRKFGAIGCNVLRAMSQSDVKRVRAINDLTDTRTLAHLLKWDSVHGRFNGEISFDEQNIIVRGHEIRILKERDPGNLPWKDLGVEVVLE